VAPAVVVVLGTARGPVIVVEGTIGVKGRLVVELVEVVVVELVEAVVVELDRVGGIVRLVVAPVAHDPRSVRQTTARRRRTAGSCPM
jgi:hypothetical protein